ncbi:MAG: response regulator [Phycisphaeraceae bacterium]|nr:response regulator [Phycisphaeraceae bacterium]
MRLLLADDDQTVLKLLTKLAQSWGYDVTTASDGEQAWSLLSQPDRPRMAILDWVMPGCDGLELCQRLAALTEGPRVYTILLTSKNSPQDMAKALEAGADDYVAKPVSTLEIRSRLQAARRVVDYESRLTQTNMLLERFATEMEQLAAERADQLVMADRMATLGVLAAGVAHEINNPTAFISGSIQTIERFWGDLHKHLVTCMNPAIANNTQIKFILEEMPNAFEDIRKGVARIAAIVRGLRTYSHPDQGSRAPIDLRKTITEALELTHNRIKHDIAIRRIEDENPVMATVNMQQIEQVLINLIVNAADAMEGRPNKELVFHVHAMESVAQITVQDNGPGIPVEVFNRIFDPFFTTKPVGKGTGLGLSITQRIMHEHKGTIEASNRPEGGACFVISLPRLSGGPS